MNIKTTMFGHSLAVPAAILVYAVGVAGARDHQEGTSETSSLIRHVVIEAATADARKAADEARSAGERAADEVMKRLRKLFLTMVKDITEELGEGKK